MLLSLDPRERLLAHTARRAQLALAPLKRAARLLELGLVRCNRVAGRLDLVLLDSQRIDHCPGLIAQLAYPADQSLVLGLQRV